MDSKSDLLKDVPLFQLMDDEERNMLVEHIDAVSFKKDKLIFSVGEPGDSLYVVQSGEVEVFFKDNIGNRIVLESLGAGGFFGELSLLDGGARTASVLAKEDCELLRIDREDLEQLFNRHPQAALDFLTAMGRRLRHSANLLRHSQSRNVNEEVEETLSFAQRIADWITEASGSIGCIYLHALFFTVWILFNIDIIPGIKAIDPYPFGFLTTFVSLEAIFLSIFVLFSQNRQALKDHIRADVEYEVNLKAELEISQLHEKLDELQVQLLARLNQIDQSQNAKKKVS